MTVGAAAIGADCETDVSIVKIVAVLLLHGVLSSRRSMKTSVSMGLDVEGTAASLTLATAISLSLRAFKLLEEFPVARAPNIVSRCLKAKSINLLLLVENRTADSSLEPVRRNLAPVPVFSGALSATDISTSLERFSEVTGNCSMTNILLLVFSPRRPLELHSLLRLRLSIMATVLTNL